LLGGRNRVQSGCSLELDPVIKKIDPPDTMAYILPAPPPDRDAGSIGSRKKFLARPSPNERNAVDDKIPYEFPEILKRATAIP
jgi:hypothetical protein